MGGCFARCAAVLSIFCFGGCAAKFEQQLSFNPSEPLRVAVMPFAFLDSNGNIAKPDTDLAIDDVGIVSDVATSTPPEFVYKLVHRELSKTGLDVLPATSVETNLLHNNFGFNDLSFDIKKIQASTAKDLCVLLNCDAVLFGNVTDWDRSYYAIQSTNSVGINLRLISAQNGQVLFSATGSDSESRGITKGPTGFSDLVLEPIRGLDSKIIAELARRTVIKMMEPLNVKNRPEYLQSAPPAIYASAHDAANGNIAARQSLKVLIFGTPGMSAAFSIGEAIQRVPMTERDEGHYIGEFYPLLSDHFGNQPVIVHLTDTFGRETQQMVGNVLVTLDMVSKTTSSRATDDADGARAS